MDNKELINEFCDKEASIAHPALLKALLERYECFKNSKSEKQTPNKDYEILSLYKKRGDENFLLKKRLDGLYRHDNDFNCEYTLETLLRDKYDIHSVKYLPTGDVFEVGQKVTVGIIKKFNLTPSFEKKTGTAGSYVSRISVFMETMDWMPFELSSLKHIPKPLPLFVCNGDGTEVFEGKEFCGVDAGFNINVWVADNYTPKEINKTYTTFTTLESACNYIAYNKPQYSLVDIKKIVHLSATELQELIDLL